MTRSGHAQQGFRLAALYGSPYTAALLATPEVEPCRSFSRAPQPGANG